MPNESQAKGSGFKIDPNYVDVPTRIAEFREKYPEGSLQPVNLFDPYAIVVVGQQTYITYTAAAYRTPDDPKPGVGVAWEPVPGKTPYTKDSELQNAETSAWGRAIVAALAADTRKGIATAEEVRNRQADPETGEMPTRQASSRPAPTNRSAPTSQTAPHRRPPPKVPVDCTDIFRRMRQLDPTAKTWFGKQLAGTPDMPSIGGPGFTPEHRSTVEALLDVAEGSDFSEEPEEEYA